MARISLILVISLAIFCGSHAQEQYCKKPPFSFTFFKVSITFYLVGGEYEPNEEEYSVPLADSDPAHLVVENRAPDFFWRPMRSLNHFLVRPTRASPDDKKSNQVKTKDFFWRPMRSLNQFLVRPTRTPTADAKAADFFLMRPMKREYVLMRRSGSSGGSNPFWVRPTRSSPIPM